MKIIISATTSWNLYNSRFNLAKALKERGNEVVLLSPYDEYSQMFMDAGFRWEHWPLEPRGKNIIKELRSIVFLVLFYLQEKPDIVHHFTPKGVVYGSFVAKLAGIKQIYNTITGLGYAFSSDASSLLKIMFLFLYPVSLANTVTIFQNPEDQAYFLKKRITDPESSVLIRSSGVDMNRFIYVPEEQGQLVIMFSSRFVKEKGLLYFMEAARRLRERKIAVKFVLVGKPEYDQPTAVSVAEIERWKEDGLVEWWGWQNNMEDIYPKAHVFCLPTYYKEGVPKVLIEAAACGRPLIATDVPGCREIIKDGYNGILIPPKDAVALANAVEKLSADTLLRLQMGKNSRKIAANNFSIDKVISEYLDVYQISKTKL